MTTATATAATPASTDVLSVRNVSAAYGPYRALFDVSFRVPDGGIVALVGSNGAGKSTVARTVTGLVTASSGQVMFSGQDVTDACRPTRSPGSAWRTWSRGEACSRA